MWKYIKKIFRWTVIVLLIGFLSLSILKVIDFEKQRRADNEAIAQTDRLIAEDTKDPNGEWKFSHEAFAKLKQIDPNLCGYIAFDDGSVREPIVQSEDAEFYLDHWIDGSFNTQGTIFTDPYSDPWNDTNTVIYGHNVFYDRTKKFSPLADCVNQDIYDNRHTFSIWDSTTKYDYEVDAVYYYDDGDGETFNFKQSTFASPEDRQAYLAAIDRKNLISPASDLADGEQYVTIQTCKKNDKDVRIVLTAKRISSESY